MKKKGKDQSLRKFKVYLEHFIASDFFQGEIKKARLQLNIPQDGFKIEQLTAKEAEDFFYFPKELALRKKEVMKPVALTLRKITTKFPIQSVAMTQIFRLYFFHNKNFYDLLESWFRNGNMCQIVNHFADVREYEMVPEIYYDSLLKKTIAYPLGIRFHQNTSQRDLVDFIQENWGLIEVYKKRLSSKASASLIGKIREKNERIQERNAFIFKNRNLHYKDLMSLTMKNFPDICEPINEGSVGKIISLEKIRRKEV